MTEEVIKKEFKETLSVPLLRGMTCSTDFWDFKDFWSAEGGQAVLRVLEVRREKKGRAILEVRREKKRRAVLKVFEVRREKEGRSP